MRRFLYIFFILVFFSPFPTHAQDWDSVCRTLAKATDEKRLDKDFIVRVVQDVQIDIDNDGTDEYVRLLYKRISITDDGVTQSGVTYKGSPSAFGVTKIVRIEKNYYFIEVERGVLSALWDLTSTNSSGDGRYGPVRCEFDREWTPMLRGQSVHPVCSRLISEHLERLRFPNIRSSQTSLPVKELNKFLRNLHAMSLRRISDALFVDIDNDGETEHVFIALLQRYNLGRNQTWRFVPVISRKDKSGALIPVEISRNFTLISGVSSGRDFRSGLSEITIIKSKGEVYVEDRHMPKEFYGSPDLPFWRVYQMRNDKFIPTCQFEFSWKTKYRVGNELRR